MKKECNLILIGMSAVGKTKTGKVVSILSNKKFIDEDDFLEDTHGKSIPDLKLHFSEDKYIELENENLDYLYNLNNHIIAVGGRTGMRENLKSFFKKGCAVIVLLKPSLEYIQMKYEEKKSDKSDKNLRRNLVFQSPSKIEEEYYLRYDLMCKNADIIIDSSYLDKEEVARIIIKEYQKLFI